jgi:hypothetical protein
MNRGPHGVGADKITGLEGGSSVNWVEIGEATPESDVVR